MRTIGIAFSCKSGTRRCLHLRGSSACCSHMSLEQVKQDIPQIQDDGNPLQQFPFRTAHYRNCYAVTRLCRQMQKEIAREIKLPRDAPKQTETHAQPTERQRSKQSIRRILGVSTLVFVCKRLKYAHRHRLAALQQDSTLGAHASSAKLPHGEAVGCTPMTKAMPWARHR